MIAALRAPIFRRWTVGLALGGAAAAAISWACHAPTEIVLRLTTDIACDDLTRNGTSVFGDAQATKEIASTRACSGDAPPRTIGTLVIAPSGARDARVSFSVVAGVSVPTSKCAENGFKGCVIARRRMRYFPGEPLTMPVDLSLSCLDIPCTEERTCSNGLCVPADVDDPAFCAGPSCPRAEVDASASAEASVDGTVSPLDSSVADVSVPGAVFLGYGVRGLETDGTDLYVAHVSPGKDLIEVLSLDALGSGPKRTVRTDRGDQVWGVSVAGVYEYFAGDFGAEAGVPGGDMNTSIDRQGYVPTGASPPGGLGIALNISDAGGPTFMMTHPGNRRIYGSGAPSIDGGPDLGYAEHAEGIAYYTQGSTIWRFASTTNITQVRSVSGEILYGIAVAPRHFWVTTRSNKLLELSRQTTGLPTAIDLSSVASGATLEDVLYVPGRGLFVATSKGLVVLPSIAD